MTEHFNCPILSLQSRRVNRRIQVAIRRCIIGFPGCDQRPALAARNPAACEITSTSSWIKPNVEDGSRFRKSWREINTLPKKEKKSVRIAAGQLVAGYPAIKVRNFLRMYRDTGDFEKAVKTVLAIHPVAADNLLHELVTSGLFAISQSRSGDQRFALTLQGEALANTSAARPIHRKTAERVLAEFMERVNAVNATTEYLYRVSEVVLFGSMLSDVEQLGDVDVAVNLEAKVGDAEVLEKWGMARRYAAQTEGRSFSTDFAWICWPIVEVYKRLKARSRSLSLHELGHVKRLSNLTYRILLGDPSRLAALLPGGRAILDSMAEKG